MTTPMNSLNRDGEKIESVRQKALLDLTENTNRLKKSIDRLYKNQVKEIRNNPMIMERKWDGFLWWKWINPVNKEDMIENRKRWRDEALLNLMKNDREQRKLILNWKPL